jgi:hypothetical protein
VVTAASTSGSFAIWPEAYCYVAEPSTTNVADRLHLPRVLTEGCSTIYTARLIEMRLQSAVGSTIYAMLDHGWIVSLVSIFRLHGPAPVSLEDYSDDAASNIY